MNRLTAFALLAVIAPLCEASQVAYLKGNKLYCMPTLASRPIKVADLWPLVGEDRISIGWTPAGKIWIEHYVDAWNGPKRFGLSQDLYASGVWIVEPKPNAKPIKVAVGVSPAFSPDGKLVMTTIEASKNDRSISSLWLTDLKTKHRKLYFQNASDGVWAPDGKSVALVLSQKDSEQTQVRAFPSGKPIWSDSLFGIPCDLQFSPNGRYLAVHRHLSRPLTGHSVYDLQSKKEIAIQYSDKYAPPVITDWSLDGKSVLCSWRIQDPENDGSWIGEDIGLASLVTGKYQNLGRGSDAKFASGGKQIVFLDSRGNLMAKQALRYSKATRLDRSVASFAVR